MGFWFVGYGGLLEAKRDRAGALAAYEEAVQILEAVLGPDHPNTKTAREKRDQLR